MILEAKSLSFSYGHKERPVLRDLSLTISSGERVGLKAPSGRGKTTLCRLLAGYERPQAGQVLLDGRPLSAYRGPCPVQMIWQHPETVVDPLLPLGKTLEEAARPDARLLEALQIREGWFPTIPPSCPVESCSGFAWPAPFIPPWGFSCAMRSPLCWI